MKEFKLDKHTSLWSYFTGTLTAVMGGITLEKFAVLVGIATSIGTFLVNWYYKRQEARRAKQD